MGDDDGDDDDDDVDDDDDDDDDNNSDNGITSISEGHLTSATWSTRQSSMRLTDPPCSGLPGISR